MPKLLAEILKAWLYDDYSFVYLSLKSAYFNLLDTLGGPAKLDKFFSALKEKQFTIKYDFLNIY